METELSKEIHHQNWESQTQADTFPPEDTEKGPECILRYGSQEVRFAQGVSSTHPETESF